MEHPIYPDYYPPSVIEKAEKKYPEQAAFERVKQKVYAKYDGKEGFEEAMKKSTFPLITGKSAADLISRMKERHGTGLKPRLKRRPKLTTLAKVTS